MKKNFFQIREVREEILKKRKERLRKIALKKSEDTLKYRSQQARDNIKRLYSKDQAHIDEDAQGSMEGSSGQEKDYMINNYVEEGSGVIVRNGIMESYSRLVAPNDRDEHFDVRKEVKEKNLGGRVNGNADQSVAEFNHPSNKSNCLGWVMANVTGVLGFLQLLPNTLNYSALKYSPDAAVEKLAKYLEKQIRNEYDCDAERFETEKDLEKWQRDVDKDPFKSKFIIAMRMGGGKGNKNIGFDVRGNYNQDYHFVKYFNGKWSHKAGNGALFVSKSRQFPKSAWMWHENAAAGLFGYNFQCFVIKANIGQFWDELDVSNKNLKILHENGSSCESVIISKDFNNGFRITDIKMDNRIFGYIKNGNFELDNETNPLFFRYWNSPNNAFTGCFSCKVDGIDQTMIVFSNSNGFYRVFLFKNDKLLNKIKLNYITNFAFNIVLDANRPFVLNVENDHITIEFPKAGTKHNFDIALIDPGAIMDANLKIYHDPSARNSDKQQSVYIELDNNNKHFNLAGEASLSLANNDLFINISNIHSPLASDGFAAPRLDIEYYNSKTMYLIVDPLTKTGRRQALEELGLSDESELVDNEEVNALNKNMGKVIEKK